MTDDFISIKYAHYDSTTGVILGLYDDQIHDTIPTPNRVLSDDEYRAAAEGRKKIVDDVLVDDPIVLTYIDKRSGEYPPITDYLDAVVKDDSDAIQAYKDACLAVKAKYPKE